MTESNSTNLAPGILVRLLARALQEAIREALRFDPGTKAKLAGLEGRTLAVTSTSPQASLYFTVTGGDFEVAPEREAKPDCRLTGSLPSLAGLALRPDTKSLADMDVYVEGNPGILNQFLELLRQLSIDWEDALANVIGTVPAHTFATFARNQQRWLRAQSEKLPGYLSEMITEELRLTPSRFEAEDFFESVNGLRADTARLEARLEHLQRELTHHP